MLEFSGFTDGVMKGIMLAEREETRLGERQVLSFEVRPLQAGTFELQITNTTLRDLGRPYTRAIFATLTKEAFGELKRLLADPVPCTS